MFEFHQNPPQIPNLRPDIGIDAPPTPRSNETRKDFAMRYRQLLTGCLLLATALANAGTPCPRIDDVHLSQASEANFFIDHAVAGDRLFVGSPSEDPSVTAGRVHVYPSRGTTGASTQTILNPTGAPSATFDFGRAIDAVQLDNGTTVLFVCSFTENGPGSPLGTIRIDAYAAPPAGSMMHVDTQTSPTIHSRTSIDCAAWIDDQGNARVIAGGGRLSGASTSVTLELYTWNTVSQTLQTTSIESYNTGSTYESLRLRPFRQKTGVPGELCVMAAVGRPGASAAVVLAFDGLTWETRNVESLPTPYAFHEWDILLDRVVRVAVDGTGEVFVTPYVRIGPDYFVDPAVSIGTLDIGPPTYQETGANVLPQLGGSSDVLVYRAIDATGTAQVLVAPVGDISNLGALVLRSGADPEGATYTGRSLSMAGSCVYAGGPAMQTGFGLAGFGGIRDFTLYGDVTFDDRVDFDDLNAVLADWLAGAGLTDANASGGVEFDDLNLLLANWGADCTP